MGKEHNSQDVVPMYVRFWFRKMLEDEVKARKKSGFIGRLSAFQLIVEKLGYNPEGSERRNK